MEKVIYKKVKPSSILKKLEYMAKSNYFFGGLDEVILQELLKGFRKAPDDKPVEVPENLLKKLDKFYRKCRRAFNKRKNEKTPRP